jgi:preprotein translocase subunit SecA
VNTPTETYRRVEFRPPSPLLKGLDSRVNGIIGAFQRRASIGEELRRDADQIVKLESEFKVLTDNDLHGRLMEFRECFRRGGKDLETVVLPALAGVREAADRKLGLRAFAVQLMGALALHRGYLAEMATGEGKTLTAGIAAVLAGWTKRPCHVVTVNDYLVERDSSWMHALFTFCGVRVGSVSGNSNPAERVKGYAADVTYVTSKELLADFLRDRLRLGSLTNPSRRLVRELLRPRQTAGGDGLVMRGLHSSIVDEADSVLIDEAVTPLIISAPQKNELLENAVVIARQVSETLTPEVHYTANLRYREIELNKSGREQLTAACNALPGLWRGMERRDELVRQALSAREFYLRDKQYIIDGNKILIVDEFTGRQMPNRTWRQGLHQAIEAKEGLPISDPSETMARLSFQRFFRCFRHLSGMTGTAREASGEFWQIYKLPVVAIPTNKPCLREHWPNRIFPDETSKWEAVATEVQRLHTQGRPILVGTRSVAASEKLAFLLKQIDLNCKIINAVRHMEEGAAVDLAGERGRITIATNMAGRGTDIKLGPGVAAMGGMHVLATELHESGRVARQLNGRAARQGDPGSAQAFISVEDEIIQRFLPGMLSAPLRKAVKNKISGWQKLAHAAFSLAQRKAQDQAYKQRQGVLRSDTWLDESLSFAGLDVV